MQFQNNRNNCGNYNKKKSQRNREGKKNFLTFQELGTSKNSFLITRFLLKASSP
jgi:hypothetical protein